MSISEKVQKGLVSGFTIRKLFEEGIALKKQYGDDKVFDLTLGNPSMEPPEEFKHELRRLAENPLPGMHRYMENAGYAETRAAVAEQLSLDTDIKFTLNEIVMTCGATGALNVVLKTLLNPGEEAIIFAPYLWEYSNYIDNHGGVMKTIPCDEQVMPRLDALEAGITPKTKAVVINSPNNPSGAVYSDKVLHQLAEVLLKKGEEYGTPIFVVSDDVYCKTFYEGPKCPRILNHYPHNIVVTSYSKDLSLPGERIGYAAVHPDCIQREELVSGLIYCNRILGYVNAPALMQNIIRKLQNVTVSMSEYRKKRDFLYNNLTRMGYSIVKPQGAIYMFPKAPIEDDVAFVKELGESLVLTVPGSTFGIPGHFRIAYCYNDRTLEGSLDGFQKVARKFNLC